MPKAVLMKGQRLTDLIQTLVQRGAPVYKGTAEATNHEGYIGLVYSEDCVERFSVDDGYKYVLPGEFIKIFRGRQLACL